MFEKKAEEYTKGLCTTCTLDTCRNNTLHTCAIKEYIKQAFLAGLKAGRPKWHKVADGYYPPCEKGNYTINVLTDCGDIAYYDYNDDCWIAEPSSAEIDPPIAWCEIPKFEKEA
jgi:hypothetical protein